MFDIETMSSSVNFGYVGISGHSNGMTDRDVIDEAADGNRDAGEAEDALMSMSKDQEDMMNWSIQGINAGLESESGWTCPIRKHMLLGHVTDRIARSQHSNRQALQWFTVQLLTP